MRKFITCLFIALATLTQAQILEPIHWKVSAKALTDSTTDVIMSATIDEGWHLYTQDIPDGGPVPTQFSYGELPLIGQTTTSAKVYSAYDENFEMDLTFYETKAVFHQTVLTRGAKELTASVTFMACNDQMCLAPATVEKKVNVPAFVSESDDKAAEAAAEEAAEGSQLADNQQSNEEVVNQVAEDQQPNNEAANPSSDEVVGSLESGVSLWKIFILGLLGGLLAIFTPCVWPIIPMTVSFFLKRAEKAEKEKGVQASKQGIRDAILYGIAIIIIYVGLGLLVTVIFGASALNSLSTSAVANLIFFAILVIFALSFFGLFEITLPASWSNAMNSKSSSTTGFLSILFMAFTLVLVSFSCTGPIIGTLLVEAASGESWVAPAIGMFGFAFALALPFSLFAMFPSALKKMPKSGGWMHSFKVILAFIELALSLKFLSVADMAYGWGILPRWLFLLLWIIIFFAMGVFLVWKIWEVNKVRMALRIILIALSWGFTAYLVPGLWGAPVKAVSAFAPPMPIEDREVFYDYEEGLAYAKQEGKPVLLDFTGYGCVNCRKMEAYVLSDETVKERLKAYVLIELYVDDKNDGIGEKNSKIQREIYGANAQPYYIQLDKNGQKISQPYAFSIDPQAFLDWLQY